MNYKPFDLEAAKRGEPLITRDGKSAKFIAHVPEAVVDARIVSLCEDQVPRLYCEGGRYDLYRETVFDLFMAPKKIKKFVNVYMNSKGDITAGLYDSSITADADARFRSMVGMASRITCVEVEFEEGQGL